MTRQREWLWAVRGETSSGGVVYRPARGGVRVALIARAGRAVWCLPKGHVEKGETLREAAVREAREETGLHTEAGRRILTIRYWFADPRRRARIRKTVHFHLLRRTGGRVREHDDEVKSVRWFSSREALERLSYPGERMALRAALKALAREPGN